MGANLAKGSPLTLNFVCDVADAETGIEVLRPFFAKSFPALVGCSVRIGPRNDVSLTELAQLAVKVATTRRPASDFLPSDSPGHPFRFMDVPPELRQIILSYTDIVAPYCEVEWGATHGLYSRYNHAAGYRNFLKCGIHGLSLKGERSPWARKERKSAIGCWETSFPHGCFCRARHAAHSTVFKCSCWAPPTAFFLVSRQMREEALQVFFTQNRFIMAPCHNDTSLDIGTPPDQLPISQFLSKAVPPDALHHLRLLEIVLPPFDDNQPRTYLRAGSSQSRDWIHNLEQIKALLNLSKLTISIHFASWLGDVDDDERTIPLHHTGTTTAEIDAALRVYTGIVSPLRTLKGLNRFFAFCSNPREWRDYRDLTETCFDKLEQDIERFIMGDHYNAVAAGKLKLWHSWWDKDEERKGFYGPSYG